MGGGTATGIPNQRRKNADYFSEKLESISDYPKANSLDVKDLRLFLYLGYLDNCYEQITKDWEFKDKDKEIFQDLLLQTSAKSMAEKLNLNKQSIRKSRIKLQKRDLVERVQHNYYKGRVFVGLTNNGRNLYNEFVG